MTGENYFEIAIHLDNIHDLFIQPVQDPFSYRANFVSGIELIKGELASAPWRLETKTRTTIFLPKASIEPGLVGKITAALQRYCQFKLQRNEDTMATFRREALIALLVGILFLVSGLFLSQFVDKMTFLPPFLNAFLSDGFNIAFWVILWRPIDFFLFELWPFWRENRIYKNIMQMEIVVSAEA
jgi:hypothetical protein